MADVVHTQPKDWKYVSEGGATIVFSYVGPPNPAFNGTVLRLRKRKVSLGDQSLEIDLGDEPDDPSIVYQTKVMSRLIPPEHLPVLQTVHLERGWLQDIAQFHAASRPEDRIRVDTIDLSRKKGVLATDLVGGDWLAVEIKPKWGFLPVPHHLSAATKSIKTRTCRFCMHTHLRVQQGHEDVTTYCPLDLFSGDEQRVVKAIDSLWDAWIASKATVNNLKIFARGKFVKPSEASIMLADSETHTAGIDLEALHDAFVTSLKQPLVKTPVLRILSELQRNLDVLDIEGLSELWRLTQTSKPLYHQSFASYMGEASEGHISTPPTSPIGVSSQFVEFPEPNIGDWGEFVDIYTTLDKPVLDHANPSPENLRYYVLAYLLSATFKDCSVIVKMDLLDPTRPQSIDSTPTPKFNVTIIDLDPKSIEKLRGWEKLDREIAHMYQEASDKKMCVDAWEVPRSTVAP
ncbi:hypothetical protein D9619_005472 [Psilocybe cf. subviscida]|uniref:Inositol-pentakisphosphate 2-kinase n=1 Tax=Psilocybe cf. subviscida TaxID=2480587 RepID=A0A8H5BWH4_9AGAR|nr:hypothetical protein D9619_005472 [Psilocybe cf. subviscida]